MADKGCPHEGTLHKLSVALVRAVAEVVEKEDLDFDVTLILSSRVCDCVATIAPSDDAERKALEILANSVRFAQTLRAPEMPKEETN